MPVEDDAHVVAGCPGTGSADCGNVASKLWLEAGQVQNVPGTVSPSDWLKQHLLQVEVTVGLILRSMVTLLPSDSAWIAPAVMKVFRLRMVERLVEVLRRQEWLIVQAAHPPSAPAPSAGSAPLTPAQRARHLTVAELCAAKTRPPSPPRPLRRLSHAIRLSE